MPRLFPVLSRRTVAPWVHAVMVGCAALGAIEVGEGAPWTVAALIILSRTLGVLLGTVLNAPQPIGARDVYELARVARQVAAQLHAVTGQVAALLAEVELLEEQYHKGKS